MPTCDVIHYDSSSRVSDVTWDETTKSLLACCVPQLQPDLWGGKGKGMGQEKKKKHNRKDENKTRKMRLSYGDKKEIEIKLSDKWERKREEDSENVCAGSE